MAKSTAACFLLDKALKQRFVDYCIENELGQTAVLNHILETFLNDENNDTLDVLKPIKDSKWKI